MTQANDVQVSESTRRPWGWGVAAGVLAIALIIDMMDGSHLKTAASALLLGACVVLAVSRRPRARTATSVAIALAAAAVLLIGYRIVGPGL